MRQSGAFDTLGKSALGTVFWIRRFLWVFTLAFAIITASQFLLRGRTPGDAALQGLIWAGIAASVFTATRLYRSRKGQHCALCRDTPEMVD
jgi:hypothetical protein